MIPVRKYVQPLYWLVLISVGIVLHSFAYAFAYDNTPLVVLRMDDGRATWRQVFAEFGGMSALDYGKLKRIPITWGVVTDWASNKLGYNPPPLSWAELIDYVSNAGGELASHSVRHQAEPSQQDYIRELINSKAEIESKAQGFSCKTFIQPGVWQGEAYLDSFQKLTQPVGQVIQQTYQQSQAYLGGGWVVGDVYYRYGFSPNMCLDYSSNPSISAVRATLDVVSATPGCTFVLYGHGVQSARGNASSEIRADLLKAVMDYLADLRDQGKIALVSLSEACAANRDPLLNRVADGGLEVVKPGPDNPVGPVRLQGSASIVSSGGVGDSKYALLPPGTNNKVSWSLWLPPGRYRVNWWQKQVSGAPSHFLFVYLYASGAGNPGTYAIYYKPVSNQSINQWEEKSAYVLIGYGTPNASLTFQSSGQNAAFGIDRVSVVLDPLDPNIAPTNVRLSARCGNCVVSWDTPNDPDVNYIAIRCSDRSHPTSPVDGSEFATVSAIPGSSQEVVREFPSSTTGVSYFSVFAVKSNGSWTGPDVVYIKKDFTPPTYPNVSVNFTADGRLQATWSAEDPESEICSYEYGIGTTTTHPDVIGWVETSETGAILPELPSGTLFLLVRAKNNVGMSSAVSAVPLTFGGGLLAKPDGMRIVAKGTVTAVFADCFYIMLSDAFRGIKVIGSIDNLSEGATLSVTGTLTTVNGERAILMDR